MDRFSCDLAVDLGSTNTLIFEKGSGIVVNEPSLVAVQRTDRGRERVLAGRDVKELLGRHSGGLTVQKPVRYGAVADFPAARAMLLRYLAPVRPAWFRAPLRVIATVPSTASDRQKAAIRRLIESTGAVQVSLMEEPRALAIGAGLDFTEDTAAMVVDIGGGITEMAVLAEGHVVRAYSLPLGGEHMDQAIARHIRMRYDLRIDEQAAERIKLGIGDVYAPQQRATISVEGFRTADQRPGAAQVPGGEICDVLTRKVRLIIGAIRTFLQSLSPRQYVDVLDRGIALAGGCSLLPNLDRRLENELQFPFRRVSDPLACLALGSGDALRYLDHSG